MKTTKELIEKLAKELKISDLKLDENGGCTLIFDSRLEIHIETGLEEGKFHLYGVLGPIPKQEDKADMYDVLMEGHLFGYGSADATFGASQKIGKIVLFRSFDLAQTNFESFLKELERFVNAYETWKNRIELPSNA